MLLPCQTVYLDKPMIATIERPETAVTVGKVLPRRPAGTLSGWTGIWSYRWALGCFVVNNLRRRYRRSVLGFIWGLIAPLATMSIMALVFSVIFHADLKQYIVYIFSGLLPWSYISESAVEGSQCFINAESYLKKLLIPKAFFPLVSVGTDCVNFIFSLTSLLLLGLVAGIHWNATVLLLPVAIAITAVFNLGMVMTYSVLTVYFRDVPHILRVIYPALFYLLPVLYPVESIPEQFRTFFVLNPFYHLVGLFRSLIAAGQVPSATQWVCASSIAAVSLVVGIVVLRAKERHLIFRL